MSKQIWFFLFLNFQLLFVAASFYWFDDFYSVPLGQIATAYNCNGSECIKFACADNPPTPFCKQCSKIVGNVFSVSPINCVGSDCNDCLKSCQPWATDWTNVVPVPGGYSTDPADTYDYREIFTCTAGTNIGQQCPGVCAESFHKNCSEAWVDDAKCSCRPGSYVCVGEEVDIYLVCDPTVCDPFSSKFSAQACTCKSGECQFMPGPAVTRGMGTPLTNKRCQNYNVFGSPGITGAPTLSCGDPMCTNDRTYELCPKCRTVATAAEPAKKECQRICMLDVTCVAVTYEDLSARNLSSNCYKTQSSCTQEASSSTSVTLKSTSWKFPSECLPRLEVMEDYYVNPHVGFTHLDPICQTEQVSVLLNVKFGELNFEVPNPSFRCADPTYNPLDKGNPPRLGLCKQFVSGFQGRYRDACPSWPADALERGCAGLDGSGISASAKNAKISLLKSISRRTAVTFPGAKITGPYEAVRNAMRNLTYIPPDDSNTNRLRSRIYSVQSSRAQSWPLAKPYEELTVTVRFDNPACNTNGNDIARVQRFLMHILDMDDPPYLSNDYSRPSYCKANPRVEDCLDANGNQLSQDKCYDCYFGPWYSFEGSTVQRVVTGTVLVDVDLLEKCPFANQQCSTVDAKVAAIKGGIRLGSKGGIQLYKETVNTQAFTGPLSSSAIALSTVMYVASTGDPTTASFNTQTLQQDLTFPTESITFDVSDQSFSGAAWRSGTPPKLVTGLAQQYKLLLNMTVVAMNNAPVIKAPTQVTALEDKLLFVTGISVTDEDADATVVSVLAQRLWMNLTENQDFINKVKITLSLLHGKLYFPVMKSVSIISASDVAYNVLKSRYSFHDLCRMKSVYNNPSLTTSLKVICVKLIDKTSCPSGTETTCTCKIVDTCADATGSTTLFLNMSSTTYNEYRSALSSAIGLTDLTCGGVPYYSSTVFTTGHICSSNDDCLQLTSCSNTLGGCLCCANLNVSCEFHSDCAKVEAGSLCGCTWNGPAGLRKTNPGQCGPWTKPPLLAVRPLTDAGLGEMLSLCNSEGTYSGVLCARNYFFSSIKPTECPNCVGIPCTYLGTGYRTCISPVLSSDGTSIADVTDGLSSSGAIRITFFGQIRAVNKVLADMTYQTDRYYNRLYRQRECYPPPLQLTELCKTASNGIFLESVDSYEMLRIQVSDLGNSGGIARDEKVTDGSMKINVKAVNNRPRISAPLSILAVEDMPFSFLNLDLLPQAGVSLPAPLFFTKFLQEQCRFSTTAATKIYDAELGAQCLCYRSCPDITENLKQFTDISCTCATDDCNVKCSQFTKTLAASKVRAGITITPRLQGSGISISDPDYLDYGFMNMAFEVNISCVHGRILLNEAFLQQRDLLETRVKIQSYVGLGVESSVPVGDNSGTGLYFLPAGDAIAKCEFCPLGWNWNNGQVECCEWIKNDVGTEVQQCRVCPKWGVGNKFISLSGTMADLNLALSNLTYIGDKYFNTRYGISEAITIVVNDRGAIGDVFVPLSNEIVIDVVVESVNNAPTIGRLVPEQGDQLLDQKSLSTINIYTLKMIPINQSLHFVEVDENRQFVFNHTWIWVDDVDAIEAILIQSTFYPLSVAQADQSRDYSCNAGWDSAGLSALAKLGDPPSCQQNSAKTGFLCVGGLHHGCACFSVDDSFTCSASCSCSYTDNSGCCICSKPPVCPASADGFPVVSPGTLLLELYVLNGKLSLYPPPGRALLGMTFYKNTTSQRMAESYANIEKCSDQKDCMQNKSSIIVRALLSQIQSAFKQRFLSYVPNPNYYGTDTLNIWISDQSFTDESYKDIKTSSSTIPINILPVNNDPTISVPVSSGGLQYVTDMACRADFMHPYFNSSMPQTLEGQRCPSPDASALPPVGLSPITISDVDVDDVPYGNVTVNIQIQAPNAGQIYIEAGGTVPDLTYYERVDEDGTTTLTLWGKIRNIEHVMRHMFFDSQGLFAGYAPISIRVSDLGNYGGPHCNVGTDQECRSFIFDCPFVDCPLSAKIASPDLCLTVDNDPCLDWVTSPNQPHFYYPNSVGLASALVDTVINLPVPCDVSSLPPAVQCTTCNKLSGCQWCLGYCAGLSGTGGGACMVGTADGGPTYQTCPSGWGQCTSNAALRLTKTQIALLAVAVAFVLVMAGALAFHLSRLRRGGLVPSVMQWGRKFKNTCQKLKIVPPDDARWPEFLSMVLLSIIALGLYLSGSLDVKNNQFRFGPSYVVGSLSSSMTLIVDGCDVRFVPTSSLPAAQQQTREILVRASLIADAAVVFSATACSRDPVFVVTNNRSHAMRYSNYFCHVEVIVPPQILMPTVRIAECDLAECTRPSSVRAGPLDPDSQDLRLDFGPDSLEILGPFVSARLDNMSAKFIKFRSGTGSLVATNLRTAAGGTFVSREGDLVVSTDRPTTVSYEQAGGLVCLTAANNSLYVDDNCRYVCQYPPVSRRALHPLNPETDERFQVQGGEVMTEQVSLGRRSLLRRALNLTRPVFADDEYCPDKKTLKNDFPRPPLTYVPGCTNFAQCTVYESDYCLCLPRCDMIPAAQLCLGSPPTCGFAGACDDRGRCCRTVCAGPSEADLFPTPDQPRDGAALDPINMPWTPGNLQQQWTLSSETGQIAVSALAGPSVPSNSQYLADKSPDVRDSDKDNVISFFRPLGASDPGTVFFRFLLSGPGVPELTEGMFLWVTDIRYLVAPWYLGSVFSLNLLRPTVSSVSAVLNPSFCPTAINNESASIERLIRIQRTIVDVLENHGSNTPNYLPAGSELVYVENTGSRGVTLFHRDPATHQFFADKLRQDDFVMMWVAVYLALCLPGLASLFLGYMGAVRPYILALSRHRDYQRQRISDKPANVFRKREMSNSELMDLGNRVWRGSGLFDLVESFHPKEVKKHWDRWADQLMTFTFLFALVTPTLVVAGLWRDTYLVYICEFRKDQRKCLEQPEAISLAVSAWVYIYIALSLCELTSHYLQIHRNRLLKALRVVHYIVLVITFFVCTYVILAVMLWVLIAALFSPFRVGPYAIAEVGFVANAVTMFAKRNLLRARVAIDVRRWLRRNRRALREVLPPGDSAALDRLSELCIDLGLHSGGLSTLSICLWVGSRLLILGVLYAVILVGFSAFTAVSDTIVGTVNCVLVILFSIVFSNLLREDGAEGANLDLVALLHRNITQALLRCLVRRVSQMRLVKEILERMEKEDPTIMGAPGEDEYEEDDSGSDKGGLEEKDED